MQNWCQTGLLNKSYPGHVAVTRAFLFATWLGHLIAENENHPRNQQRNYNIVDFSPVAKNGINMDKQDIIEFCH